LSLYSSFFLAGGGRGKERIEVHNVQSEDYNTVNFNGKITLILRVSQSFGNPESLPSAVPDCDFDCGVQVNREQRKLVILFTTQMGIIVSYLEWNYFYVGFGALTVSIRTENGVIFMFWKQLVAARSSLTLTLITVSVAMQFITLSVSIVQLLFIRILYC